MNGIGNIFRETNPYEKFVQQLVELESRHKLRMQQDKVTLGARKAALGEVSASVSRLNSLLKELSDSSNASFKPFTATSSNNQAIEVHSASGFMRPTTHQVTIERLASRDIQLSELLTAGGVDLAEFGDGSVTVTIGDETLSINLNTQATDSEGNPLMDEQEQPVLKNNEEILQELADSINELFGSRASATVFNTDGNHIQLSVQSLETGKQHAIEFQDATGVLAEIAGSFSRPVATDELNARFTLDGVTFERSQNLVDDAIEGLVFSLSRTTETPERITVERDLEGALSNVNAFMEAFNEVNKVIRDRTYLDAQNNQRGIIQDMRSVRSLSLNLRQLALSPMQSAPEGSLSRLADMGIGFENNGNMKIADRELLENTLLNRSDEVMALFSSEDSGIARIMEQTESYTRARTGIIATITSGIEQQMDRVDLRIAAQDRHLERYEQEQREIFNRLDKILTEGQQQFEEVLMFQSQLSMFFRR